MRAAIYIDGFNFYHAVADLGENHLKWCDLRALAETIIPRHSETIERIVYCTAYYPGDEQKKWRHLQYIRALKSVGVDCIIGHYIREPMKCRSCLNNWEKPTEKESDINLALSIFNDAAKDVYDKAYMITADSDQLATLKFMKSNFREKGIVSVAPPERPLSVDLVNHADAVIRLRKSHVVGSLFPATILPPGGGPLIRRPREYDPPEA